MKRIVKRGISAYQALPPMVKATVWFTVCNVIQKGISLLSTPIFTRILSQSEYGQYAQYQSWVGIVTIFVTLNLFLGDYTKGLIEFEEQQKEFTSALLSLTSIITLSVLAIHLVIPSFFQRLLGLRSEYVVAMLVEIFFLSAFEFWAARERFHYRYVKLVAVSLLSTVLNLSLSIGTILLSEDRLSARIYSDVAIKSILGLILFIYIMWDGKTFWNKRFWKYALLFNLPLIPHFLSNFVLSQADRIMIGRMVGDAQTAKYSVAYTISMMMNLLMSAINNSFVPYEYKGIKANQLSGIRKNASFLVIGFGGLSILPMIFAPEIISIFAESSYRDAIYVVPPIAASVFFIFVYSIFINIEYYFNKTVFIACATCVASGLNLLLNYIFIRYFGYYAAGYTTLTCYILLATGHFYFYRRTLRLQQMKEIYDIKIVVAVSLAVLGFMLVLALSYPIWYVRYILILAMLVLGLIKRKVVKEIWYRLTYRDYKT